MKVYICGSRQREHEFYKAEVLLRHHGHIPVNPIKILHALPEEISNSDFTVIAFELIRISDAVYLLDKWENDLFASMELAHSKRMEKEIIMKRTEDNANVLLST